MEVSTRTWAPQRKENIDTFEPPKQKPPGDVMLSSNMKKGALQKSYKRMTSAIPTHGVGQPSQHASARRFSNDGSAGTYAGTDSAQDLEQINDKLSTPERVWVRVLEWAEWWMKSRQVQNTICAVTLLSCLAYVIETYMIGDCIRSHGIWDTLAFRCKVQPASHAFLYWFEIFSLMVFAVDFVASCLNAPAARDYVLTLTGVLDLASLAPLLGYLLDVRGESFLGLFTLFKVFKAVRITRLHRLQPKLDTVDPAMVINYQIRVEKTTLWVTVASIIFVCASVTHMLQYWAQRAKWDNSAFTMPSRDDDSYMEYDEYGNVSYVATPYDSSLTDFRWHDGLYFTVVTLSTVGYGDMAPDDTNVRFLVIFFIMFCVIYIPMKVSRIQDLIQERQAYERAYPYNENDAFEHVVLCGKLRLSSVYRFLMEFSHSDHAALNNFVRVVLLCPLDPDQTFRDFLEHPRFRSRVFYIQGSPKVEENLRSACAHRARSIFLLANHTLNFAEENDFITMSAIMIDKFLLRNMQPGYKNPSFSGDMSKRGGMHVPQIIAQAHTVEAARILKDIRVDIPICNDVYKSKLMAIGMLHPGFVPLFTNLVRSSFESNKMTKAMRKQEWLVDYLEGSDSEMYAVRSSETINLKLLHGKSWGEVARIVYVNYGCVLCGLTDLFPSPNPDEDVEKHVVLNPGNDYRFTNTVQNLFIVSNHRYHAVNVIRNLIRRVSLPGVAEGNVSIELGQVRKDRTEAPNDDHDIKNFFLRRGGVAGLVKDEDDEEGLSSWQKERVAGQRGDKVPTFGVTHEDHGDHADEEEIYGRTTMAGLRGFSPESRKGDGVWKSVADGGEYYGGADAGSGSGADTDGESYDNPVPLAPLASRVSIELANTTFQSPVTARSSKVSTGMGDFYKTAEYQHEAKRLLSAVKPLVTELQLSSDATTQGVELAEVETTIGRILAMYLSFVARSAPNADDMSKSLERILHEGGLELAEVQKIVKLVYDVLEKRKKQRLDLQNHIVITFPGSHEHMIQIVHHFIKYFTEHEPRPVVILHEEEEVFKRLKELLQRDLKEATAKAWLDKAKFTAKKKRALTLKEQAIRLQAAQEALEAKVGAKLDEAQFKELRLAKYQAQKATERARQAMDEAQRWHVRHDASVDELEAIRNSEPKGGWDVWLFFSPGSAERSECLENVSILNACAFLSIASREGSVNGNDEENNEFSVRKGDDTFTVKTAVALEKCLDDEHSFLRVNCMYELANEESVNFLRQYAKESRKFRKAVEDSSNHYQSHLFNWPMFAAGRICTQSILDTLLVRLATDPGEADFWNMLLGSRNSIANVEIPAKYFKEGGRISFVKAETMGVVGAAYDECLKQRQRERRRRGSWCVNMHKRKGADGLAVDYDELETQRSKFLTFGELFVKAQRDELVVLGLYRPVDTKGARLPYMHSVPKKEELVFEGDRMMVLNRGYRTPQVETHFPWNHIRTDQPVHKRFERARSKQRRVGANEAARPAPGVPQVSTPASPAPQDTPHVVKTTEGATFLQTMHTTESVLAMDFEAQASTDDEEGEDGDAESLESMDEKLLPPDVVGPLRADMEDVEDEEVAAAEAAEESRRHVLGPDTAESNIHLLAPRDTGRS